MSMFNALK